ncbi:uncharacterized protein LOC115890856 [Sitophilus oryzae]|uniref:Uncharacterized protein LOC115890856 n=1 Tax=Sitophilus oryzae TaxID=7048 RepID=A0A6J2YUW2_SITOR|nr:uncharacterized protein LOC115890856 [Sitophilus oryzae]
MDHDLENFTYEPMYIEEYVPIFHMSFYIEVLYVIAYLADLSMTIYLIVVIKKFKTLENSRSYKYLFAYAISNLCYILLSQTIGMFLQVITNGLTSRGMFILANIDNCCMELGFYILTFMAIDWYVFNYYKCFYDNHLKVFNRGVLTLFLIFLFKSVVAVVVCFPNDDMEGTLMFYIFLDSFSLVSFYLCFIMLTFLFIKWKRKTTSNIARKYEYSLIIPWTYFMMSLPMNIVNIYPIFWSPPYGNALYDTIDMSTGILSNMALVVIVFLLGKYDKHFKMAYLKCCKRRYKNNNFQDEVSEDGSEENGVTYDGHVVSL